MEKHLIGRSSEVAPLIAKLYDAQQTYKVEKQKNDAIRAKLACAVTEVLGLQVNDRESELVADVLIELMRQAEKDLRQAMAEQLSIQDNVPLRLILQLANDEIEIARPVLMNSAVLSDMDLIYIIKSKTEEYWQAIAARKKMGDQVIDVLSETRNYETALTMLENQNIRLTEESLLIFSDMVQGHESLAVPLLRRPEISEKMARALYKFVGDEMKEFISKNFDVDAAQISETVDRAVSEFSHNPQFKDFIPEEYMINAAKVFQQKGMLNSKLMLSTLRRGHIKSFVAQFSVFTGFGVEKVCQMLLQSTGQGLAVASKAFGIEKQDFTSIFMLTSKIRDHGRMVEMDEVRKAMSYYNLVSEDAALKIIREKTIH